MNKLLLRLIPLLFFLSLIGLNAQTNPAMPFDGSNSIYNSTKNSNKIVSYMEMIQSINDVFINGGNRLVEMQNPDGGWGWELEGTSALNTIGPIGMGLSKAYQQTGEQSFLDALQLTGNLLLTKTDFSTADGYLAAELDRIFGVSTYSDYVKTNFYDKLADGSYEKDGVFYNTEGYVNFIRTRRSGDIANLAAWDLGLGLVGAAMCGASTQEWVDGVKAEINELDGNAYYDVIGLAGALYGLAYVGEDFDPTSGEHAAASSINDLANILVGYQINNGGFSWNSQYVIPDDSNETIQETAYAILALNEIDRETYLAQIEGAANYIISVQLATGGWENNLTTGENNEVTGEALWGTSISFPTGISNETTGVSYPSLQAAINDASEGDLIIVDGGTHNAISISTNGITLIGNGAVVNNSSPAITINANNVTVDGFTFNFDSASDYAIEVGGDYYGIVVKNCNFLNTDGGGVNPGLGIDNASYTTGLYYVDATENNNWNHANGPTHASNPGGAGVTITDYVIYGWDGLVSPVNSVSGVSVIPTFEWNKVKTSPAPTYKLIVSENSDLSSPIYSKELGGDTTVTIIDTLANFPLNNNDQYYWAVEVYDDNGLILTSSTYYFYTVDGVTISVGYPAHDSDVYLYDPLQFSWYLSQAQGSLRFLLQVKDTNAVPDGYEWENYSDFEFEHLNTTYRSVNGLSGGTKYYWRVIAYHDNGGLTPGSFGWDDTVVKFSSDWSFLTKGGAVKAYPSWPIGGNTIYNLEPTFYWYTLQYEPAAQYAVLYSKTGTTTGDSLDTGVTELTAGTNTYVSVLSQLEASTDYYWQVRTSYNGQHSYSSVAEFTTYDAPGIVATPATLSYPVGGIDIYTTSPTFYWYTGAYNSTAINFTVEISIGDADFADPAPDFTATTTDTYVQITGLTAGLDYYWRVMADDGSNPPVASTTVGQFSIVGGSGSYPVASWPVGNPTIFTNTPTLSWYLEGSPLGWDHYMVAWSTSDLNDAQWQAQMDAASPTNTYSTSDMNETFFTFTSGLDYGQKYYWAVAAYDGSSTYSTIAEASFTIAGGNVVVTLTSPADNEINVSTSPTFYWYVSSGSTLGIEEYRVVYSKTEFFTEFKDSVTTTSTYAPVNSSLDPGGTYWWYVRVKVNGVWSTASVTNQFTVEAGAYSVMPLVGSPTNGVPVTTTSPVLSWYLPTESESALLYEVEIADNPEFSDAAVYSDIAALNAQVESLEDGEYFWRVKSKTDNSESSYSNLGNFKVGNSITSVDDNEELPLTYSIKQNYPNPFNPSTTIKYSVPNATYVTIKVYNMLGQEVKTLVNKDVAPGRFSVIWNGDNNYGSKVSSGTYIYQIVAGDFVQTKKMILLK